MIKGYPMMNQDSKWIKVINSKEAGEASGKVFATLTEKEKEIAGNIMGYRKTIETEKGFFYVGDCEVARKLFAGFFEETKTTFN
jgi:hypothetical protein